MTSDITAQGHALNCMSLFSYLTSAEIMDWLLFSDTFASFGNNFLQGTLQFLVGFFPDVPNNI